MPIPTSRSPEPGSLAETLRGAGLRATGPRLLILETLLGDASHPTPETLHGRLRARHPSLSLSTVYQTLEAFVKAGLCRRVNAGDNRLRVDGTALDQDHAVCRACGRVFDIPRTSRARLEGDVALPERFTLVAFPLNIRGRDGSPVRAVAVVEP